MKKILLSVLLAATTLSIYATEGAMRGVFSVAANKKVAFSKGNLQYQASTQTWQFATNQYDTIGSPNRNTAEDYEGWIDLFGWGTGDAPTKVATNAGYSTWTDWGVNAISNGGSTANSWYTMTMDEWAYLMTSRPNASQLFGLGTVNGIYGLILLPDTWVLPTGLSFTDGVTAGLQLNEETGCYFHSLNYWSYGSNVYTVSQWTTMQNAGAVFLPAAGARQSQSVHSVNQYGYYWTSSDVPETNSDYIFHIKPQEVSWKAYNSRYNKHSVRLVSECIDTIRVNFTFPEAGDDVPHQTIWTGNANFNANGELSIPEDAPYEVAYYEFFAAAGGTIAESKFNPNTQYKMRVVVRAKQGYTFPMDGSYPYRQSIVPYFNGERVEIGGNFLTWSNGQVGLYTYFTTGDAPMLPTPVFNHAAGELKDTAYIAMSCSDEGAAIYYTTDGSTPSATNGTLFTQPYFVEVTSANENTDLVFKAVAVKNGESSEVVSCTYNLKRTECQFVLHYNAEQGSVSVNPETAKYGDEVTVVVTPAEGYELYDIYVNAIGILEGTTFTIPARWWQLNITVTFQIKTLHVTFVDWDGTVLKPAQDVVYGNPAVAPVDPERPGHRFIGWDKDFSAVTEDMTVTAQYEQLSTGVESVFSGESAAKVSRNGQIFIRRGEKIYTLQGAEVK